MTSAQMRMNKYISIKDLQLIHKKKIDGSA